MTPEQLKRLANQIAFGFDFTEEFHEWLNTVVLAGECCVIDRWTYGKILVFPDKGWKTI